MIQARFSFAGQDIPMRHMIIGVAALLSTLTAAPVVAQEQPTQAPAVPAGQPVPASETDTSAPVREAGYEMAEIVAAADGALGDASQAVAQTIEKIFADLGKPNAYIVGREGGGALIFGLRYGQGQLHSKIEGERTVHWTGPSLGADIGGDVSRVFTLVYNLHDTEEIFARFPALEGRAYLVGGLSVNYHQLGDIVLVPIRVGAGWRLGANVGYMKYTRKGRIIPF